VRHIPSEKRAKGHSKLDIEGMCFEQLARTWKTVGWYTWIILGCESRHLNRLRRIFVVSTTKSQALVIIDRRLVVGAQIYEMLHVNEEREGNILMKEAGL
jgi:hypothetical protein